MICKNCVDALINAFNVQTFVARKKQTPTISAAIVLPKPKALQFC